MLKYAYICVSVNKWTLCLWYVSCEHFFVCQCSETVHAHWKPCKVNFNMS